jgi:hypothetical protein
MLLQGDLTNVDFTLDNGHELSIPSAPGFMS